MSAIETFISDHLNKLKANKAYRTLKADNDLIDFSSNDYLGFSHSVELKKLLVEELDRHPQHLTGATGSRLISGNTDYALQLENQLSKFHNAEAGLLFNSGYDANLGIFSSLPQKGDTIILDEKIHACIIDGSRLSYADRYKFRHNDLYSLEQKLKIAKGNIFIGIEGIYSMDGDIPDLKAIVELAEKYGANIIIDEAHSAGVLGNCGKGLVSSLGLEDRIFARIHTFGKAIGSHGAVIMGSENLRNYLINTARSFIYTTAAPFHSLASVKVAYDFIATHSQLQSQLAEKISLFRGNLKKELQIVESNTPIQSVIVPGNEECLQAASLLQKKGYEVSAVRAPTVEKNKERLRICLHLFNSDNEINKLANDINQYL